MRFLKVLLFAIILAIGYVSTVLIGALVFFLVVAIGFWTLLFTVPIFFLVLALFLYIADKIG